MNDLSFDVKTSTDFFNKLLEDYNEFLSDEISSRIALNCSMTAWHLTAWIYNEFNNIFRNQFPTLPLFQQDIKSQCTSLQSMQDLANGSKHYLLNRHQPIVKETNVHEGPFSSVFSREFNTTTLEMELNDIAKIYFKDEIEKVINFWRQYFQSTLQMSIQKQIPVTNKGIAKEYASGSANYKKSTI